MITEIKDVFKDTPHELDAAWTNASFGYVTQHMLLSTPVVFKNMMASSTQSRTLLHQQALLLYTEKMVRL